MSDERDRFWDLSNLIPSRKKAPASPFSHAAPLTDLTVGDDPKGEKDEANRLTFPGLPQVKETVFTYSPLWNKLLISVTVTQRTGGYRFYEQFRRDALSLQNETGTPVPYVPFYSSMPQYAHLDAGQRAYYLYFRDAAKRGEEVRCDESYYRLLLYEILNLPEAIPPEEGIVRLTGLWRLYGERFPALNRQIAAWITDYCLIYRLPCPSELIRPILDRVMAATDFREFFLGEAADSGTGGCDALLAALSDYKYGGSRYSEGEIGDFLRTHITAALSPILRKLVSQEQTTREGTVIRHGKAFLGALCSYAIKYELALEYRSFSGSLAMRKTVTNAVKYAENKIRAIHAVRSRLAVGTLEGWVKESIDAYFDRLSDGIRREKEIKARPAYEALYDSTDTTLSFEGADEIERDSWENTQLLVPEEDLAEFASPEPEPEPTPPFSSVGEIPFSSAQLDFLYGLLTGDGALCRSALQSEGIPLDRMAESVNETAAEYFGDIVLALSDDGYTVIDDYREDVATWTEHR